MKRCKSGKHWWGNNQTEQLEKCCNGWVRLLVPRTRFRPDETKVSPFNADGWGEFCSILVHESETQRIQRLRGLELAAEPVDKDGQSIIH